MDREAPVMMRFFLATSFVSIGAPFEGAAQVTPEGNARLEIYKIV